MLIKGRTFWCRIVGSPGPGFDRTDPKQSQWSFDLCLDKDTKKELVDAGLKQSIKNKGDDRGDFISLKRKAFKRDGNPAQPIRVVDAHGDPWGSELIGNGSVLNVSIALNERENAAGKKFLVASPLAVQVWEHKKYEPKNEFPISQKTNEDTNSDVAEEEWS